MIKPYRVTLFDFQISRPLLCAVAGLACLLSLAAQGSPATQPGATAARRWELLAHGSGERLWYAVTTPAQAASPASTIVREREMHDEAWRDLSVFPSRLIAMADLRGQLVAALEDGDWKRISAEQFTSGPPLPGHGDILALAGEEGSLWSVGFAEGARPQAVGPATRSATRPAATRAAGPTTRPEQLQLYKLAGESWTRVAALPVELRAARGDELSMAIQKGAPMIAYKSAANVVHVLRFDAEKQSWDHAGRMKTGFTVRKVKLLVARDLAIGWAVGDSGVGSFFFPDKASPATEADPSWREQVLSVPSTVGVMDVSAAAAKDELHLFVIRPDEEFVEQKYDLSGRLSPNSLTQLDAPKNPGDATPGDARNWGLLGLLMVITLVAANKGGAVQVVTVNKVELGLAPFALRLAAGLIDLWPAYLGYVALIVHSQHGVKLSQLYTDRFAMWAEIITLGVYFLHTAIGELIWGRSLGKMVVGLRVVGLDGRRAPLNAILLRNFMRVIEVPCMMGFPLLVMFFNPLRQRLGDFAAGTLVVAKVPVKMEKEKEEAASA